MLKSCCALPWLWTQWWLALTCNTVLVQLQVLECCKWYEWGCPFYHKAFSSSGVYTCIVLQRLWPNSFLPQGNSAQLPHPPQSPNQNHISGQWARLLAAGPAPRSVWGAYNSCETCPEHTVEQDREENAFCPSKKLTAVREDGCARAGWSSWWCIS